MMKTQTQESQAELTPAKALTLLRAGNQRFVTNLMENRDLLEQVNETHIGQYPFAIILSCIDSRTSAELIFDQGLGDIFSVRIAGNCINGDILGSMEFACKIAGSKLVVVLGHTGCGAVKGAISQLRMGHLTSLLNKLRPAVDDVQDDVPPLDRTVENPDFVHAVAQRNVELVVEEIMDRSLILADLLESGALGIVGGMYDVATGVVTFMDAQMG